MMTRDRLALSVRDATMLNQPEPACLVIADITGYTSYLAGVELDHAQDILADLIDTVVSSLRPTYRLAKLEGDAAFTFALTATVDASTLMDTIERTYFAFRRRLRDIGQASVCDCNACIRMPALDLKFLAHHGTVLRQRIAGREELLGSDVILAHRLLKNSITETLGIGAYALYTDACLAAAGADPHELGLIEHHETYDHVGEVTGWVEDLGAEWTAEQARTVVVVEAGAALSSIEYDLPAPAEIAWDYLTSPARRLRWQPGITEFVEDSSGGRRGVGTTNHCVHGKDAVVEEVLDWTPVDHFTIRFQMPIPNTPKIMSTYVLTETDEGTHVEMRIGRPRSTKDRAILEAILPGLEPIIRAGVDAMVPLIREEMGRRAAEASDAGAEPALPLSAGRFILEPVDSAATRTS